MTIANTRKHMYKQLGSKDALTGDTLGSLGAKVDDALVLILCSASKCMGIKCVS